MLHVLIGVVRGTYRFVVTGVIFEDFSTIRLWCLWRLWVCN